MTVEFAGAAITKITTAGMEGYIKLAVKTDLFEFVSKNEFRGINLPEAAKGFARELADHMEDAAKQLRAFDYGP